MSPVCCMRRTGTPFCNCPVLSDCPCSPTPAQPWYRRIFHNHCICLNLLLRNWIQRVHSQKSILQAVVSLYKKKTFLPVDKCFSPNVLSCSDCSTAHSLKQIHFNISKHVLTLFSTIYIAVFSTMVKADKGRSHFIFTSIIKCSNRLEVWHLWYRLIFVTENKTFLLYKLHYSFKI